MLKETGQVAILVAAFRVLLVLAILGVSFPESSNAQTTQTPEDSAQVAQDQSVSTGGNLGLGDFSTPFEIDDTGLETRPLLTITGLSAEDLLNMRAEPSVNGRIVNQLPAGAWALPDIERLSAEDNPDPASGGFEWVKVWVCGQVGWVAATYLAPQPDDFPAVQDCPEGLVDPIKLLVGEEVEVELGDIAAVPDEATVQAQRLSVGEASGARRNLGQSILSTEYVACVALAQSRSDQDQTRVNEAVTACLADERDRWREDMGTAFTLLVATLDRQDLRAVRDNQRDWQLALRDLCADQALQKARPFTRLHLETCELKMTVDRTTNLEAAISARSNGGNIAQALDESLGEVAPTPDAAPDATPDATPNSDPAPTIPLETDQ